ncbi:MAG: OmpA family protein [Sandaracinaceae bacterium]|nr:OmpA family protein [Sandaracinaceae bacterium]
MKKRSSLLILCGSLTLTSVACGAAHPSIEIANARTALVAAQQSPEGRRVPAELLVAQRSIEAAERAQEDEPDSSEVTDLVYIADRQTRIAVAHGRRMVLAEQVETNQAAYQHDLETTNRSTRDQLENTEAALSATGTQVANANVALAQQGAALETERAARVDAERRASEAMTRLQALASVREQNNETVITILGALLFRSGGSQMLSGANDRLMAVASVLTEQPTRNVTITGYTDSTGSAASNETLSLARAEGVRSFLISHGVSPERVRAVGRGPSDPVADNGTSEGRANNRRVEIVLGAPPAPAATAAR